MATKASKSEARQKAKSPTSSSSTMMSGGAKGSAKVKIKVLLLTKSIVMYIFNELKVRTDGFMAKEYRGEGLNKCFWLYDRSIDSLENIHDRIWSHRTF